MCGGWRSGQKGESEINGIFFFVVFGKLRERARVDNTRTHGDSVCGFCLSIRSAGAVGRSGYRRRDGVKKLKKKNGTKRKEKKPYRQ